MGAGPLQETSNYKHTIRRSRSRHGVILHMVNKVPQLILCERAKGGLVVSVSAALTLSNSAYMYDRGESAGNIPGRPE